MHWSVRLFGRRVRLVVEPEHWTTGICSDLPDGMHILMWDFDMDELAGVVAGLASVQRRFELPAIVIWTTGPGRYHAYSLTRLTWPVARGIVATTPSVDVVWLGLCMRRGFFTLRIGQRGMDGPPRPILRLPGYAPPQARWEELEHVSVYSTPKG